MSIKEYNKLLWKELKSRPDCDWVGKLIHLEL